MVGRCELSRLFSRSSYPLAGSHQKIPMTSRRQCESCRWRIASSPYAVVATPPGRTVSLYLQTKSDLLALTFSASNSGPDGVTIDLSRLDKVTVANNSTQASLGPGARWATVYTTLNAQGVSVSGGRVSSVGVGGLTLGGSFFSFQSRSGATTMCRLL